MSLSAPYATSSSAPPQPYGDIAGATSNWARANLHDAGRSHAPSASKPELGTIGFTGWSAAESPPVRSGHRIVSQHEPTPSAHSIAEPAVMGAHSSYYSRRALPDDDPTAFRRSVRNLPQVERPDRPHGKRAVPEPQGPISRPHGVQAAPDEVRYREAAKAPEPGLPKLLRPPGCTTVRENWDQEYVFEQTIGRKIRVGQDSYRGLGNAGDTLSPGFGAPPRPEDDVTFFRTLKDSPTFLRFCSTLAPLPEVSAHERRSASLLRKQQAELTAEQQLVAALELPGEDDD